MQPFSSSSSARSGAPPPQQQQSFNGSSPSPREASEAGSGEDLVTTGDSVLSLSVAADDELTFPLFGVLLDSVATLSYRIPNLLLGFTAGAANRECLNFVVVFFSSQDLSLCVGVGERADTWSQKDMHL